MTYPSRPTWLEIDTGAIAHNVRLLRRGLASGCLLTAVVKANAYGHGVELAARAALDGGAHRFAVATLSEAVELRRVLDLQAPQTPILILGYTPARDAAAVVAADLTPTIYEIETAHAFAQAAQAAGRALRVHVKVNTGMNRLGIASEECPALLQQLKMLSGLEVEGIFTHFATADTDLAFAKEQFRRFSHLLDVLQEAGLRPPIAHAANSAATLLLPDTHLDMVRCGIAIYGLHPDAESARLPVGFQPALSWKAEIAHVFEIAPGDAVSYGREYIADQPRTVAVIPVGYADGFPRRPRHWQHVLVHGYAAPILGRVCMDQTVVDVSDAAAHAPVRQGDEAVLIGSPRDAAAHGTAALTATLTVDEVADWLGTINYDVVSRILARVPRLEVNRPTPTP